VAHLVFAPSAINDAHDILTTLTEKAGRAVAVAYFERFRLTFDRLTAFPLSGAPRHPPLCRDLSYDIRYGQIIRVVYGRRRIRRRLLAKG
jgi:plasmid stabilization system protein ParE